MRIINLFNSIFENFSCFSDKRTYDIWFGILESGQKIIRKGNFWFQFCLIRQGEDQWLEAAVTTTIARSSSLSQIRWPKKLEKSRNFVRRSTCPLVRENGIRVTSYWNIWRNRLESSTHSINSSIPPR